MSGFTEADVPDQSGKCFIVTGANTGLGFEASRVLAARGGRVLLACRDKARAEDATARIRESTPDAELAFLPLLASVRAAAELAATEPRIDVLINNAGVMYPPLARTKQGFELQFGVNHLGSFALTSLLLPKLAETAGARVVVTGSIAHRGGRLTGTTSTRRRATTGSSAIPTASSPTCCSSSNWTAGYARRARR